MNTKLTCLLLDDELPGLTYLKMICEQIPALDVLKAYNNPHTFLKEVETMKPQLCILDIEMPGMSGLEVAASITAPVIFTTAYKEFGPEAFELDAIDYLVKPVKKERLEQAVLKAKNRLHDKVNTSIQLNADVGKVIVQFDQLTYIRSSVVDSRDKILLMRDGTEVKIKNMAFDKLLSVLPKHRFIQVNKKECIAIDCVKYFSADEITTAILIDGKVLVLKLGASYRKSFIEQVEL